MQKALIAALLAVLAVPVLAETEIRAITEMREGIRAKWQGDAEWAAALSGDKEAAELAGILSQATLAFRTENGGICDLEKTGGGLRFIVLLRGEKVRLAPAAPDAAYDRQANAIVVSVIPEEQNVDRGIELLMLVRKARLTALDRKLADEDLYRNWQTAFAERVRQGILRRGIAAASR